MTQAVGYFDPVDWRDALVCGTCGAVVHPVSMQQHRAWHDAEPPAYDGDEEPPPYPEPIHSATQLWHDVMIALDHTGQQANQVTINPGHARYDGEWYPPELNVYLSTSDPADLRRFAAHLGMADIEPDVRTEVKERSSALGGGMARVTYWSIERDRDDADGFRRVWCSRDERIEGEPRTETP